jgi:hypothetical protein
VMGSDHDEAIPLELEELSAAPPVARFVDQGRTGLARFGDDETRDQAGNRTPSRLGAERGRLRGEEAAEPARVATRRPAVSSHRSPRPTSRARLARLRRPGYGQARASST